MVKHILTTECPRSCFYCITKNIKIEEVNKGSLGVQLPNLYWHLSMQHDSIMLTGGEPSAANHFIPIASLANQYFKKVFITTQDEFLLRWEMSKIYFKAITFSWHDLKTWRYEVKNNAIVYASILPHLYSDWLLRTVKQLGYAGLTINENHYGIEVFDEQFLIDQSYKVDKTFLNGSLILRLNNDPFTIKINRRGNCFKQNTVYIMPDLSIHDSFEEFL